MLKLKRLMLAPAILALSVVAPLHISAKEATMFDNRGAFQLRGKIADRSCTAQTNLQSASDKPVGLALYWRPKKSLFLLVSHPDVTTDGSMQKIRFRFPDGKSVALKLTLRDKTLQARLGIGSSIPALFHEVKISSSVNVELVGLDDSFRIDLAEKGNVQQGLLDCQKWLNQ
ncbi:MAG: hypothetical protein GXP05_03815 [Alphaproteobacteria bacterium]|nr:hypothetical protein [Alphaproteobacteria bacterium]